MSRSTVRLVAAGALIALLGVVSFAIAGGGPKQFHGTLNGYEENPDVSTGATGSFDARVSEESDSLEFTLSYSGLEGSVLQSHVHFGKPAVNGGISFFLCTNLGNGPAGTAPCPPEGTVTGTITSAQVVGPSGQGITAGEFDEILAAIRAGRAYANVHSSLFPGGEIRAQLSQAQGG